MATSSTQTLALGCRDFERVRFDYRAANGSPSSRRVEPHQLVPLAPAGTWWATTSTGTTGGRSGSIGSPPPRAPVSPSRPVRRPSTTWPRSSGPGSPAVRPAATTGSRWWSRPPADTVTARVGRWAEVTTRTPTSCMLTMNTDSLDGPLFALGSLGAEFTVVAPPDLTALAAEWGARLVRSSLR